ncbi:MAG: S41 family peptidase [Bacteroidales bacterium]|nr:S41 family peptidase [Bacteroidales bacterium]
MLNYIDKDYVDSVNMDQLQETAIEEMLAKLDPHSIYISAEEFHAANDPLMGKFDGIGVQFRMVNDTVVVILPLENGPSQKAGIQAGDRIVIANTDTLTGRHYSSLDIQKRLKGERGSIVNLFIKRKGERSLLPFLIKRDAIPTYSIDAKFMLNDSVAYIKLSRFAATTIKEFSEAMEMLKDQGMKELILDLRGNSGGYLGAAIFIADEFLDKGSMIVYTEGRNRPKETYYASGSSSYINEKIILLIDQNSASAAEIVAGAIQDNDRGLLVGRRTFGKGLVQEQANFIDGSAVRLTVSRYFTPSGRCIQRSYKNGTEAYYNAYYERLHKEMLSSPDSTSIPDSLKYKTRKGRIVYGGGGIWPDVFIPADTSINFTFYNKLINQSIIYQFAFDYVEKNRKALNQYLSIEDFKDHFDNSNTLYNQFLELDEVKKLNPTEEDIKNTKHYITTLIKAEIARNLFEDGFYPIYIANDNYIKESLLLLQ